MIEIRLLGQVSVRNSSGEVPRLVQQRKHFALLIYLLLGARGRYHERHALTALFWPRTDEQRARHALRKALYALRLQLGPNVFDDEGQHRIGITEGAIWCDALDLIAAARSGQRERVVEAFTGEMMPGFHVPLTSDFDHWLDDERARLWRMAYDCAMHLAQEHLNRGHLEPALHYAGEAKRIWPTSEDAAELAIRILHSRGNHAAALEDYRVFANRLARDLDLTPSRRLLELVNAVRLAPHGKLSDPC